MNETELWCSSRHKGYLSVNISAVSTGLKEIDGCSLGEMLDPNSEYVVKIFKVEDDKNLYVDEGERDL